jgi:hypothetical protein
LSGGWVGGGEIVIPRSEALRAADKKRLNKSSTKRFK